VTFRQPSRIATWLLHRLGPSYHAESLRGDLFEEYQLGRTNAWYWRQTLAAICIGTVAALRRLMPRLAASALLRFLTVRSARRRPGFVRKGTPIRRLSIAFVFTALSAGTLTWAGVTPQPQQCSGHGMPADSYASER
jgi:hypothetical protein